MEKKKRAAAKPEEGTIVISHQSPAITRSTDAVEGMITTAIKEKTPIETMEKLFAMRRELKAEFSKAEFDSAMAKFQGECPVIEKKKEVKNESGKLLYVYAPLDSIVAQTAKLIEQNGFSYSFDTDQDAASFIKAIITVTHKEGHEKKSSFAVPNTGGTSIMSGPQKYAAALTFAKRYVFCNAFGIMTGDEDNDAVQPPEKAVAAPKTPVQAKTQTKAADAPQTKTQPAAKPEPVAKPVDNRLIDEAQMCEIADLLKALKVTEEKAVVWMGLLLEQEVIINRLKYTQAQTVIKALKVKLEKQQETAPPLKGEIVKEPVVNVVDPSRTERAAPEEEKPVVPYSRRAQNCASEQEAKDIIGEMTLTKESHPRIEAVRGLLKIKGYNV